MSSNTSSNSSNSSSSNSSSSNSSNSSSNSVQQHVEQQPQQQQPADWIGYSNLNKVFYNGLLASFTLGASLITHPLTVLSIRQQAGVSPRVGGNVVVQMSDAFKTVGIRGLFRGWVPMSVVGAPSNIIYFDLMEKTREIFQDSYSKSFPNSPSYVIDGLQTISSSIVATFVSLIPFVPGEVLSSRLIVQGKDAIGAVEMSKFIYREKGMAGFFRGFNSSFLVGMVGGAQWWYSYGLSRKFGMQTEVGKKHPILVECGAGLVSGLTSTVVAYPLDTIKTRIMTSCMTSTPHSFPSMFLHVIRSENSRALFRGMPAAMYQAAIGSTLFAGMYELIKDVSQKS